MCAGHSQVAELAASALLAKARVVGATLAQKADGRATFGLADVGHKFSGMGLI